MSSNVKFIRGNIFTSNAQTLVNTVNCVGIMGAGIALEFKFRYPEMFRRYTELCRDHLINIGKLYIYDVPGTEKKVINFPTKKDWKHPSKIEYLRLGLDKFVETYTDKGITSIAFPLLGAQKGGLDPVMVRELMTEYLQNTNIPVEIYEYTPDAKDDLVEYFTDEIIYNKREFKNSTGFTDTQVDKLREIISDNDPKSLIQLHQMKGIGEETLKAIFQFAMRAKAGKLTEQALFNRGHYTSSNNSNGEEPATVSENPVSYANGDQSPTVPPPSPSFGLETIREIEVTHSPETNTIPSLNSAEPATNITSEVSNDPFISAPVDTQAATPKKGTGKKTKKTVTLTIGQKQLMTNLSIETIEKIESSSDLVTIADLKAYVRGLKLKWKKFVTDKYLKETNS